MTEKRPAGGPVGQQAAGEVLDDLVLELTDLSFHDQDGVRRAAARARLAYQPAAPGQSAITSAQSWPLVAPLIGFQNHTTDEAIKPEEVVKRMAHRDRRK